jgi:UDP-glucose 4-epimerase
VKILVTGAAGFIASNTIELLLKSGHEVVGIDNLSTGSRVNIPEGIEFIEGDCGDIELILSLKNIDACMHFAGSIITSESMTNPDYYFNNNVANSLKLLNALAMMHVKYFIFSSSAAAKFRDSPYGESKYMIEQALYWMAKQNRIRGASLRYFNASGGTKKHPENHYKETHLIPNCFHSLENNEKMKIFGNDYNTPDGTCIRDYIHVSDLAQGHLDALNSLNEHTYIQLNLGTGIGYSNLEVVKTIEEVTGKKIDLEMVSRREGDPDSLVASVELTNQFINWNPQRSSLKEIIKDAWEFRV